MVTRFIESAWENYKKNFWTIIGANIVYLTIVIGIVLAGMVPLISAVGMEALQNGSAGTIAPTPQMLQATVIFMAAIFIAVLAAIALRTGLIGVYANIINKKKAEVGTMLSVAKDKIWTSLGSTIITAIIIAGVALALVVPTAIIFAASKAAASALILMEIAFILFFALLFSLINQAIVVGNLGAADAVKSSFTAARNNYAQFLGITLIFVAASFVLSIIPVLGPILAGLIIQPMIDMSYTQFYMEKAGKKRKR